MDSPARGNAKSLKGVTEAHAEFEKRLFQWQFSIYLSGLFKYLIYLVKTLYIDRHSIKCSTGLITTV